MKASFTAIAALIAIGFAAPAFAQTAVPAPTAAPSVTAPAKKADHKTVAQAPKKDEHINKDGAKSGTVSGGTTGSTTAPKAVPEKAVPEKKAN
jgi:hypothetical protein